MKAVTTSIYYNNESSTEQKFPGQFAPESESSKEKSSRERTGQGPVGTFAPRSELAWERKGSVPLNLSTDTYSSFTADTLHYDVTLTFDLWW